MFVCRQVLVLFVETREKLCVQSWFNCWCLQLCGFQTFPLVEWKNLWLGVCTSCTQKSESAKIQLFALGDFYILIVAVKEHLFKSDALFYSPKHGWTADVFSADVFVLWWSQNRRISIFVYLFLNRLWYIHLLSFVPCWLLCFLLEVFPLWCTNFGRVVAFL